MTEHLDERIHMRDRGRSRDIGLNPTFTGAKPVTRQETHELSVGGYGRREESVSTFAATAVGFSYAIGQQTVIGGAGAFRGYAINCIGTGTGTIVVLFKVGGLPAAAVTLNPSGSANGYLGDIGVGFNSLTVEIIVDGTVSVTRWDAAVIVASTE